MERRLPDTPWHVGYAKKAEDDSRRHKSRCIHNVNRKCNSSRSCYYKEICGGSSHCGEYSESYEDYKKKQEERKTAEEIERDNIKKYKDTLESKKRALAKSANIMCHKSTDVLRRCLVCDEGLKKIKFSLKKCTYCGMYYVNLQDSTQLDVLQVIKAEEVFLMNIPKKKDVVHESIMQINHGLCVHMNKKNRCTFESAKCYKKRCKEYGCNYFKRM